MHVNIQNLRFAPRRVICRKKKYNIIISFRIKLKFTGRVRPFDIKLIIGRLKYKSLRGFSHGDDDDGIMRLCDHSL